jgi:hypothetical protein
VKAANITAELVDGRHLKARTVMRDIIAYETTAKKQRPPWGGISENPGRWETFVSWSALRRTGQFEGNYEAFLDEVVEIDFDFDEVVPTNGASSDISSPTSP